MNKLVDSVTLEFFLYHGPDEAFRGVCACEVQLFSDTRLEVILPLNHCTVSQRFSTWFCKCMKCIMRQFCFQSLFTINLFGF